MSGVSILPGNIGVPHQHLSPLLERHYSDELTRCMRYLQRSNVVSPNNADGNDPWGHTSVKTLMRVAPTIVVVGTAPGYTTVANPHRGDIIYYTTAHSYFDLRLRARL